MSEIDPTHIPHGIDKDLQELRNGAPLTRHAWLQDVLDDPVIGPNGYGQNPPRNICLQAMLTRVTELAGMPQRDMELEKATVELGRVFTSGPGADGGSFVYEWVRATEVYEDRRTDGQIYQNSAEPQIFRSDIIGIGGIYAGYALGSELSGLGEENDDRWFMRFRCDGISAYIPFDAITEVVDGSTQTYTYRFKGKKYEARYGSVIESPTDRSSTFIGWRQLETV